MADRGYTPRRVGSGASNRANTPPRTRNVSGPGTSLSARSSDVFDHHRNSGNFSDYHQQQQQQPIYSFGNRNNSSLRSVASRVSLSEQFATTRREYEFGYDDGMSLMAPSIEEDEDEEEEYVDPDDTLTGVDGFDRGVVVVEPASPGGEEGQEGLVRRKGRQGRTVTIVATRRSHYELLCLPEGGGGGARGIATKGEIRRAYLRLLDILRSRSLPKEYQETAEGYFRDVQVAFETLIGKASKEEYDAVMLDDDGEEEDEITSSGGEDDQFQRTDLLRFVRRLRRQQEQEWTEVGLQMDTQPLFSSGHGKTWRRQVLPAALSLTQTSTAGLPAVREFLEPKLRRARNSLRGKTASTSGNDKEDLELYCTSPTVTFSSSVYASNATSPYLPPAAVISQHHNVIPDIFPKDRPLQWYSTCLAPLFSVRLRQELFLRERGLSETALKRTLPDAAVEIEADTLNAACVTARASHTLRMGTNKDDGSRAEPLHVEASISMHQPWLAGTYGTRVGLAIHRRVVRNGGTVFACVDNGTSSLWKLTSPASFWSAMQHPEQESMGQSWRTYMDQFAHFLDKGMAPYFYSPPTVEVGYRFNNSINDTIGMTSGRPLTKQARSGLRCLHSNVDLVDQGQGGSWTVSGAVTAGGVASYLRYGRDLFSSGKTSSDNTRNTTMRRWGDLLGLRMEAEISTQKMTHGTSLGWLTNWMKTDISHLAVRGVKKISQTSKLGLELGVSSASNSVVLSLYFSQANNGRRIVVPLMLFQDYPLSSSNNNNYTTALFWGAFLPALSLAAVDYVFSSYHHHRSPETDGKGGKEEEEEEEEERKEAKRAQYIHRRRAEADGLVTLLAEPVTHRQQVRHGRGGLVVLSAKYGVLGSPAFISTNNIPNWAAPEEVADVTVAMAALVDHDEDDENDKGRLLIPAGLRKSRLLGFWDPNPGRTKCLVVRYWYNGREGMRAVMGREELSLP